MIIHALLLLMLGGGGFFLPAPAAWFGDEIQVATAEYDLDLKDWQQGKLIRLEHPLFQLEYVSGAEKRTDVISFHGKSFGEEGRITIDFYTLDGDLIHLAKESLHAATVDQNRRRFIVSAVIPPMLRGKTGAVQVTFEGRKRAAFLLRVKF